MKKEVITAIAAVMMLTMTGTAFAGTTGIDPYPKDAARKAGEFKPSRPEAKPHKADKPLPPRPKELPPKDGKPVPPPPQKKKKPLPPNPPQTRSAKEELTAHVVHKTIEIIENL